MHAIRAGEGDVFLSAGVETVSRFVKGSSDAIPDTQNPIFAGAKSNRPCRRDQQTGAVSSEGPTRQDHPIPISEDGVMIKEPILHPATEALLARS